MAPRHVAEERVSSGTAYGLLQNVPSILSVKGKLFKQHIISHEGLHIAPFKFFFVCVCQVVCLTDTASSQIPVCEKFGCSVLDSRGSALCKLFSGGILVVWKFIHLSSIVCLNFHLPLVV